MIAQITVAAVELQDAVPDLEAGVGGVALGHRGEPRRAALAIGDRARGPSHHQARRLQLRGVIRDPEGERLEVGQARAELLALAHIGERTVEAELRAADRAGRDVEPSAVEARHRDAETLAFLPDAVRRR